MILEAIFAMLIAFMLVATIVAALRLDFGPSGPTPVRILNIFVAGLCALLLAFECFCWRDPGSLFVTGIVGLAQTLGVWSRYKIVSYVKK